MRRKGRKGGEDAAILPRGYEKSHAKPRQEPRPGRGRYGVEPPRNSEGYWVDGGRVLSEATSEMSPLPRFDSAFASAPRLRSGLGETGVSELRVPSHQ